MEPNLSVRAYSVVEDLRVRISGARPYVSPASDRPVERAADSRRQPRIDPDTLYREITAPHANMSALIVDPRPEHVHPLLRQEVEAMRVRAKLRERTPNDAPPARVARPRVEHDTLPEANPQLPPALRQARSERVASSGKAQLGNGTVVERTDRALPAAPTSTRNDRRTTPPSTAALHSAVRGNHLIGRGYKGREVVELQTLLKRRGFNVATSGSFDADTESAVRIVQRRAGLPASGVFDLRTMAALEGRLTRAS